MTENRFDGFTGDETIFMFVAFDTFAQFKYEAQRKEGTHNSPENVADREMMKKIVKEIVAHGRVLGCIPEI